VSNFLGNSEIYIIKIKCNLASKNISIEMKHFCKDDENTIKNIFLKKAEVF